MRRHIPVLLALASAIAASGCAGTAGTSRYAAQLDELRTGCTARGGILVPSEFGTPSGQPQTEYVCKITDGASRLQN